MALAISAAPIRILSAFSASQWLVLAAAIFLLRVLETAWSNEALCYAGSVVPFGKSFRQRKKPPVKRPRASYFRQDRSARRSGVCSEQTLVEMIDYEQPQPPQTGAALQQTGLQQRCLQHLTLQHFCLQQRSLQQRCLQHFCLQQLFSQPQEGAAAQVGSAAQVGAAAAQVGAGAAQVGAAAPQVGAAAPQPMSQPLLQPLSQQRFRW
jgi:hypothetical protein